MRKLLAAIGSLSLVLAIATPASSTEVANPGGTSIIDQVPERKTLSGLGTHIKAIELSTRFMSPLEVEYAIGPTADPVRVQKVIDSFAKKLKVFQRLGLTGLGMDWALVSEKDYEWWREYRLSQESNYPLDLWDPETNVLGHCRLSSEVFCGAGNTVNGKEYQDNVVGTRFTDRGLNYVARHEAAHFYQAVFGYGGSCWFAEGQATFFETYLESSSRSRNQVLNDLRRSPTGIAKASLAELEQKLSDSSICDGDSNIAYNLGMLAFEYLYLNYSLRDVHNLMVVSSSAGWEAAVESELRANPNLLNSELAEYVFEQLN